MQITTFRNADLDITVKITIPAQKLIGIHNVVHVVKTLTDMMAALCADYAYVSKRGSTLEVHVSRKDGWTGTMRVKR